MVIDEKKKEELIYSFRFLALDIAAREAIEMEGHIKDLDRLYARALSIFDHAYKNDTFFDWKSQKELIAEEIINEQKKAAPVTAETKPTIQLTKDSKKKVCPNCGDEVPLLMKIHIVGSKGKCGFKFTV
jgi:hypothetical protein